MDSPFLYEVNTRCWLDDLSRRYGYRVTLSEVPEDEIASWRGLGFSHIWMMGVWQTGPRVRAKALSEPEQRKAYLVALPDWREEDVDGSPYAIAGYEADDSLGGPEGLLRFRQKLHQQGLKLVLDFIPNHVGLDHPWLRQHPELFVRTSGPAGGFLCLSKTVRGEVWVAHGRDPNFPPWTDTAQLDYRNLITRQVVKAEIRRVAGICDGLRCDMAMLSLSEVFASTWREFPTDQPASTEEFWPGVIENVKRAYPGFMFLAEVYWELEKRLQELGFDYTYDKELYDNIVAGNGVAARRHLYSIGKDRLGRDAHFLENHDERRVASVLPLDAHRAAAFLVLTLPGMPLLHEGQFEGRKARVPVQLRRRLAEPVDQKVANIYGELLGLLRETHVRKGHGRLVPVVAHNDAVVATEWCGQVDGFDLAVVNLDDAGCVCAFDPNFASVGARNVRCKDFTSGAVAKWRNGESLRLELEPYGFRLIRFTAA